MRSRIGINIYYDDDGTALCRLHKHIFKADGDKVPLFHYYCDGLGRTMKPSEPLYEIGFEYLNEDEPVTDWFYTEEDAVESWKMMKSR